VRWLVLAIVVVACSNGKTAHEDGSTMPTREQQQPGAPTPTVTFMTPAGDVVVQAEVVATRAAIMKGLMFREHLAPDAGMLFLMGSEEDHAFYMRNTLIPLDMIFITRDLTVAGVVANAEPRTETNRRVGKPSLYVLEVNGGWAAAHQVTAGTKVRFERVKAP
jgi:uncharacterized protein